MDSSTHPSPSTMPPFQRSMKCPTLGKSSTYPSPARSDSDTVNYSPDGLGLYNYSLPLSAAAAQSNTTLYPPSPQPTESWVAHLTCRTSPLVTEAHTDSWPSLYEPPVSRSPLTWNNSFSYPSTGLMDNQHSPRPSGGHALSHRSSLSSSYDASNYSQEELETRFTPKVKLEAQREGHIDDVSSPSHGIRHEPQTVSPERLSMMTFPYAYMYDSPAFTKFESPFEEQGEFEEMYIGLRDISGRRRSSGRRGHTNGPVGRTRIRRNPTTPENANFSCQICGRLFQRSYNLKSHLQTHNPTRPHPNHCPYPGCERRFVRRTDLLRHEQSVHIKARNFKCSACDAHFARKDTLRRHEEDGCPRRFELMHQTLSPETTSKAIGKPDVPHDRQSSSFGVHSSSPISPMTQTTPLFKDESFPGSPTGY